MAEKANHLRNKCCKKEKFLDVFFIQNKKGEIWETLRTPKASWKRAESM
jgi:hypothetical protein